MNDQAEFRFDGDDYVPERDDERLTTQLHRIWALMIDGKWRTLEEISRRTSAPQPSALAQLGHMRKVRFGSHQTPKRKVLSGDGQFRGLYEYKLIPNSEHPRLQDRPDVRAPSTLMRYRKALEEIASPETDLWDARSIARAALDG